jgi:hypothetical protein
LAVLHFGVPIRLMSLRTRKYVLAVITLLLGALYAQLAGGWGDLQYYGGAACVLAFIALIGLPWLEFAPDGAFRRRPQA